LAESETALGVDNGDEEEEYEAMGEVIVARANGDERPPVGEGKQVPVGLTIVSGDALGEESDGT